MLKIPSLPGKTAGRFLLIAAMGGLMVGCGSSSGDTEPGIEFPADDQDFDGDGIPDANDDDADGDGLDDFGGEDNFVDLNRDGLDDITLLTEAEANAGTFTEVSAQFPCGSEDGEDNASANNDWNDNCVVKRSSKGGQFADSLFAVGIQRVLYCSGFGTGANYTVFADGEFGPNSENATIDFQRAEFLAEDGIVGPLTWARLRSRVELLAAGITTDTYGFSEGRCADIPMFYQSVSESSDGQSTLLGGWTLARNQPNADQSVPFSYQSPFGRL